MPLWHDLWIIRLLQIDRSRGLQGNTEFPFLKASRPEIRLGRDKTLIMFLFEPLPPIIHVQLPIYEMKKITFTKFSY